MKTWTTRYTPILALTCALSLLVVIAVATSRSTDRYLDAVAWADQTQDVIANLDAVLLRVSDAVTAQRGFLLTANNEYLGPLDEALLTVPELLHILKMQVGENRALQEKLAQLDAAVGQQFRVLHVTVESPAVSPRSLVPSLDASRASMVTIRSLVSDMRSTENELLAQRAYTVAEEALRVRTWIIAGTASAVALLLVCFAFLRLEGERRRCTERELRESNLFLDSVIENIPSAIFIKRAVDLVWVRVNRAYEEAYGMDRGSIIGRTSRDVLSADEANRAEAEDRSVISRRTLVDIPEARITLKGKGERSMRVRKVPLLDAAGEVRYLLAIAEDLTDYKQATARVRQAEERYRLMLENVADYAIFTLDTQGCVTSWNVGAQRIQGYQAPEVLGLHVSQFYPAEARRANLPERLLVIAATQGRVEDEGWRVRKDGSSFWASVLITAVKGAGGELLGYVKVARDLTERKRAEEALRFEVSSRRRAEQELQILNEFLEGRIAERTRELQAAVDSLRSEVQEREAAERKVRESEARLAVAQRMAHLGSWEADLAIAGGPPTGVVRWSEETFRIFGRQPAELALVHDQFLRVVHPEDAPMVREAIETAAALGVSYSMEYRIVRPDGTECIVHEIADLETDPDSGRPVRLVGTVQDITERKRGELALMQAKQELQGLSARLLQVQEAERHALAREFHDEIGPALTLLKIEMQKAQQLMPQAASQFQAGIEIAENALQHARDISLRLRPAQLDDLGLELTLRSVLRRHAEAAGWQAEVRADRLAGRLTPEIETTCFRIAQEALTNVARHAGAKRVEVSLAARGADLELTVSDDGSGLDLAAARLRGADRPSLGLVSMRERAALVGGRLEISRTEEGGTRVQAVLPLRFRDAGEEAKRA